VALIPARNLSQANKLSRTYAVLLETLNRHRGKGQPDLDRLHLAGAQRATESRGRHGLARKNLAMLDKGLVKPLIHATFPLEQARQAHEMMESSSHLGKILLVTGK
jgi:NADPH:quinone reductase-like Zn-dependent oxidoreductase